MNLKTFSVGKLFAIVLLLFFFASAQAQSPETSAFSRFGETPVSLYSGRSQVSLPVCGIAGRDLQVPVSLQYQSGGVKVEDYGSNVGLSWILDVGGVITRSIQGVDDFDQNGSLSNSIPSLKDLQPDCTTGGTNRINFIGGVVNGTRDGQPDVFYYSLPGAGGKFVFDSLGNVVDFDRAGIRIQRPATASGEWIITTLDGTRYYFGGAATYHEITDDVVTAWYLKKIVSPRGEEATFTYQSYTYTYSLLPLRTEYYRLQQSSSTNTCEPAFYTESPREYTVQSQYLQQVTLNDSRMVFTYGARCDLSGARKLDLVEVYRNTNEKLSEYRFSYDCYAGTRRLWLTSVQEIGLSNKAKPPYRFEYYKKEDLPSAGSMAQDYWGYYNKADNENLIPTFNVHDTIYIAGANRDTNLDGVRYGTLSSITYPTGGRQEFTYEAHTYQDYDDEVVYQLVDQEYQVCQGGLCGNTPLSASSSFELKNITQLEVEIQVTNGLVLSENDSVLAHTVAVRILGPQDWSYTLSEQGGTGLQRFSAYFPPGDYSIEADLYGLAENAAGQKAYLKVNFKSIEQAPQRGNYQNHGGGVRISRIATYDGPAQTKPLVKRYEYHLPDNAQASSGRLMIRPQYYYYIDYPEDGLAGNYCTYLVRTSSSVIPASASANGNYVGYDYVLEYEGDLADPANGRVVSQYYNVPLQPSPGKHVDATLPSNQYTVRAFPNVPPRVIEPRNGYLKSQEVQRSYSGTYVTAQLSTYIYDTIALQRVPGVIIASKVAETTANRCRFLRYDTYENVATRIQLRQRIVTNYDGTAAQAGNAITDTTSYTYQLDSPWLVRTSTGKDSDGAKYVRKIFYSQDYAPTAMNGAIGLLQSSYRLAAAVDIQSWRIQDNEERLMSSTLTTYKAFNSIVLPYRIYASQLDAPVLSSSWTSYTGSTDPDVTVYKMEQENNYDAAGNLVQVKSGQEDYKSFVTGYAQARVMAEVVNASEDKVAYTGFEDAVFGKWQSISAASVSDVQAHTGHYSYTGSLSKTGLPAGRYEVALWARGNGGTVTVNGQSKSTTGAWALYYWQLDIATGGTVTVAGSGSYLDDIRLHPAGAFMTTYTYEPGIGVSSVTGPQQRSVFYTYDALHRRELVKDHDGNVVQRSGYQYAGLTGFIQYSSIPLNEPAVFTFEGNNLPGIVSYSWTFGDDTPAQTGSTVSHIYTQLGGYTVTLTVSANGVTYPPLIKTVYVDGSLSAGITVVNNDGLNMPVSFSAVDTTANPEGTVYSWNFGDGNRATGLAAEHAYTQLGTYPVTLTISHISYASVTVTYPLTVPGQLQAVISPATLVGSEGSALSMAAVGGTNPPAAMYTWSFGDNSNAVTGSNISHVYASGGTYTVTLSVSYAGYSTVTAQQMVTVNYINPVLSASTIHQQNLGTDTNGYTTIRVSSDPAQYGKSPYTYLWYYKDGSGNWINAGSGAEYDFVSNTPYDIKVIARDSLGHYSNEVQGRLLILSAN